MIVEKVSEIEKILSGLEKEMVIAIPLWVDTRAHPAVNTPSVLYLYAHDQDIIIPFDHNEGKLIKDKPIELPQIQQLYVPSKKNFTYFNKHINAAKIYDVDGMEYLNTGLVTPEEKFYIPIQRNFYSKYENIRNVNKSVPLLSLYDYFISYRKHIQEVSKHYANEMAYEYFNMRVLPTLYRIEANSLNVDREKYIKHFGERSSKNITMDNHVYTWYNPYTTTGRPSNRWGGVNYSALNKADGSREAFIGSFNSELQLIDFESFHLRIIGDLIHYDFPSDKAVHTYLAEQYFHTTEITPELYEESKKMTFTLLYGDTRLPNVPRFIKEVWDYTDRIWKSINEQGWLNIPRGDYHDPGRGIILKHISDPTPAKVFNYMIQGRELEEGIRLMEKLMDSGFLIHLYTYDSVLLNHPWPKELKLAVDILESGGKYPVRVFTGKNYNELHEINKLKLYSENALD